MTDWHEIDGDNPAPRNGTKFEFSNGQDVGIGWFVDHKFCSHDWVRFKGKTVAVFWRPCR